MSKDISGYIQGLVRDEVDAQPENPLVEMKAEKPAAIDSAAPVDAAGNQAVAATTPSEAGPAIEDPAEIEMARQMEAAMQAEKSQNGSRRAEAEPADEADAALDAETEMARQMEQAMAEERALEATRAAASKPAVPVTDKTAGREEELAREMEAAMAAEKQTVPSRSTATVEPKQEILPAPPAAVIDAAAAFSAVTASVGLPASSMRKGKDEAPPVIDARQRFVSFNVADQCYALPIASVQEVLPMPNLMPVPGAPAQCPGVVNLRGEIVTALDLRTVMGLPPTQASSLVVLNDGLALCVDTIGSIINAVPNACEAPPNIGAARPFVGGITRHDGRFILLLDEQMLETALPSANAA